MVSSAWIKNGMGTPHATLASRPGPNAKQLRAAAAQNSSRHKQCKEGVSRAWGRRAVETWSYMAKVMVAGCTWVPTAVAMAARLIPVLAK